MGHKEHKEKAPEKIRCAVITVSDTRTEATDTSGKLIKKMLEEKNHEITVYHIVKDEKEQIENLLKSLAATNVQAIITNGGTGVSKRDRTFEVVFSLIEKKIEGFGELFRYLCYKEIGSSAMMSRAVAGVCKGQIIISIPGSENAVRLAMESLILPELGHMVWEINR
jgi:molybdenum cofactor biosynthesis protein B